MVREIFVDHNCAIAECRVFGHDRMETRAGRGGNAAMESAMKDTAQLRVEVALLRARVDTLQNDLMDLVALHAQTLDALAQLAGTAPRTRQESGSGA